MKHVYFILTVLILCSCQNEESFERVEELNTISTQSELNDFVLRLTQNPTAFDDFIDGTSALRLELPFEVSLNSETNFTISDSADYQTLIDEISEQPGSYTLSIIFPAEVSFSNYERLVVQNESEFMAAINLSSESSEINCIEYDYPLNIRTFDAQNSLTDNRVLQNKAQFHNLIKRLKTNNGFYELDYPITISIEGLEQSLLSNTDLIAAIESLDQSCFNPSLFDATTITTELEDFIAFVTEGEFQITLFEDEDGDNETSTYQNLRFVFATNNNITVENTETGETFAGNWDAELDEGELVFDLNFEEESDDFEELAEDWVVDSFGNPNTIVLFDEDDDNEQSQLIFEKL